MGKSLFIPLPPLTPPATPFTSSAAISDEARCEGREGEVRENVREDDKKEGTAVSEADTANVDGPHAMETTLGRGKDGPY